MDDEYKLDDLDYLEIPWELREEDDDTEDSSTEKPDYDYSLDESKE